MFNRKTRNIISTFGDFPWLYHPTKWQSPLLVARRTEKYRNEHVQQVTPRTVADFAEEKMGSGQVSSMCWDGFTSKIAKLCRFRAWTLELYLGCCTLMFNTWIWDSSDRHMADVILDLDWFCVFPSPVKGLTTTIQTASRAAQTR